MTGVQRYGEMTSHFRLRTRRSPPDGQTKVSAADCTVMKSQVQVGVEAAVEDLIAEMYGKCCLLGICSLLSSSAENITMKFGGKESLTLTRLPNYENKQNTTNNMPECPEGTA